MSRWILAAFLSLAVAGVGFNSTRAFAGEDKQECKCEKCKECKECKEGHCKDCKTCDKCGKHDKH